MGQSPGGIMTEMIGLAEAAQQLGIPYQNAHRLVLTGVLKGEKRDNRWWVLKANVDDLANSRHQDLRDSSSLGEASS